MIVNYFKGAVLARMSNGTYCIIRPLGLVKGGKGLKHHENLLTLSVGGVASKLVQVLRRTSAGVTRPLKTSAGASYLRQSKSPATGRAL
jgi:hypothetical protein